MSKGRQKDAGTEGSFSIMEEVRSEAGVRRVERLSMARTRACSLAKESEGKFD